MTELARRVLRGRGANASAQAESLASSQPRSLAASHLVADRPLVFFGAGNYVNQLLATATDAAFTTLDAATVVELSRAVGVTPAVEVTAYAPGSMESILASQGFVSEASNDIAVLTSSVGGDQVEAPTDVTICEVANADERERWKQTSAAGWGHTTPEAIAISDAFVEAVQRIDGEHLFLAHDADDGRVVGCASSTVRSGLAILGGMSTLAADRGRGVQAALIRHRLDHAARLGCDLAAATASAGGASERNLRRHGFEPLVVIRSFRLASG